MKRVLLNLGLSLLTLGMLFLVGEVVLRLFHIHQYGLGFFASKGPGISLYQDTRMGWRATENYSFSGLKTDAGGQPYQVVCTTDARGFRLFGDPTSPRRKILFLGDSYTHALEVSNDKTYYARVAAGLQETEVFAAGVGGYGTLQEYLLLDEFFDLIKPDLIVWQLCSNDIINNVYELEAASFSNNNGMRRPYLNRQGQIYYRNPTHLGFMPDWCLRHLRLCRLTNLKYHALLAWLKEKDTIEKVIAREGRSHSGFRAGVEITAMIFRLARQRTGGCEIVCFSVDAPEPYYRAFQEMSQAGLFHLVDGIPQALDAAQQQGLVVKAADLGHWNELGHQIVANKLVADLQKRNQ